MYGRYDDTDSFRYHLGQGLDDEIPEPLEYWTLDDLNDILPAGGERI